MTEPTLDMRFATPEDTLAATETRLVDVVDNLLDHGVHVRGELWLTVADVDLVFLGVDLVLANPDTIRRAEPAA